VKIRPHRELHAPSASGHIVTHGGRAMNAMAAGPIHRGSLQYCRSSASSGCDQKMIELELQRTSADLDEPVCAASHDLKAPLQGIGRSHEWLVEDLRTCAPRCDTWQPAVVRYPVAGAGQYTCSPVPRNGHLYSHCCDGSYPICIAALRFHLHS